MKHLSELKGLARSLRLYTEELRRTKDEKRRAELLDALTHDTKVLQQLLNAGPTMKRKDMPP